MENIWVERKPQGNRRCNFDFYPKLASKWLLPMIWNQHCAGRFWFHHYKEPKPIGELNPFETLSCCLELVPKSKPNEDVNINFPTF